METIGSKVPEQAHQMLRRIAYNNHCDTSHILRNALMFYLTVNPHDMDITQAEYDTFRVSMASSFGGHYITLPQGENYNET